MEGCSSEACQIVLNHVVPSLGVLTVQFLTFASWPQVQGIVQAQSLGPSNPLPYPLLAANSFGWLLYGLLLRDYYIFLPNLSGFVMGIYYTMACYVYAEERLRHRMIGVLGGLLLFVLLAAMVAFLPLGGRAEGRTLMGFVTVGVLMLFYVSPLSTILLVLRTRDVGSLNLALILATLVNCGLWIVYGLVIGNLFVTCPNGFGIACAAVQLACYLGFRGPRGPGSGMHQGVQPRGHPSPEPSPSPPPESSGGVHLRLYALNAEMEEGWRREDMGEEAPLSPHSAGDMVESSLALAPPGY